MTVRAIAGLVLCNAFLLLVGLCLAYGFRSLRSWTEVVRLAGLSYLLGVAGCGVVWVLALVVSIPFGLATILVSGLAVAAVGVGSGRLRGHELPTARPHPSVSRLALVPALFAAATIVVLEALFRAGRLRLLTEYDAWAFWVPKAKAIYFFHRLDLHFFTTLPGPSYPPLLPAHEAVAFHFMGAPDAVTLHLQFWFFAAGFVAAVVGLLAGRVPAMLLWPSVLLALVSPAVVGRALQPQADLLLDALVAAAALLVGLWLLERSRWQLEAAAVLFAGAMLTKREGFLLAACVLVAALVATVPRARTAWPRLALVGVVAFLVSLPWRIWFEHHGLPSDAPDAGGLGLFDHLDRAWPSLRLTIRVLFEYDNWLLVAPLAVLAVVAAVLAGRTMLAVYAGLVFVLGVAGFTWVTWSFPTLAITDNPALNPIVRSVGALVVVSAGLVPLLLASAWKDEP